MKYPTLKAASLLFLLLMPLGLTGQTIETESADESATTATAEAIAPPPPPSRPTLRTEATTSIETPQPAMDETTAPTAAITTATETVPPPAPLPTPDSLSGETTSPTEAATPPAPPTEYLNITFPTAVNPPTMPQSDATSTALMGGTTYQTLQPGTGRETDTSSTRRIHYILWLKDGTYVESSLDSQLPLPFNFTPAAGEAIKGMEEGTAGMRIGEVRKLYVPSEQAYGSSTHGNIKPNSDLIFVIKLVDLVDPVAKAEAPVEPPPH